MIKFISVVRSALSPTKSRQNIDVRLVQVLLVSVKVTKKGSQRNLSSLDFLVILGAPVLEGATS